MFKENELRLLWPFYLMVFLGSCSSVTLPVWMIFFQNKFTFTQISFALAMQSLAAVLFEIPTGAIADIFGRKFSVITGITMQGLLWLVLPFIDSAVSLCAAFFLMGTLRTLESGADNAWIVDWLNCNNEGRLIHDMFVKIKSLNSAGLMISSLLASLLLFFFEIRHLFFVQGYGYLLTSLLLFFFARETIYKKAVKGKRLIRNVLCASKEGTGFLFGSKMLLYLVLATSFAICSKNFGCVAWQPLFVDLSLPVAYLGIIFSGVGSLGIVTPFLSKKLLKLLGYEKYYLAFTTIAEFALLMALYFIESPFFVYGVVIYAFAMIITGLQSPVDSSYFQSLIPGEMRATIGSVQSMIFAIFSFISGVAGGYVMDRIGSKMALIYFSFFLIPAVIFYLLIKDKSDRLLMKTTFAKAS